MLVEAAWAAAKAPGPLHAFFVRIRARRGHQVAAMAVVGSWPSCAGTFSGGKDYLWARPALVATKKRSMELQAGQPVRKGNRRGPAYAYNVKGLRNRECSSRPRPSGPTSTSSANGGREAPARGCASASIRPGTNDQAA